MTNTECKRTEENTEIYAHQEQKGYDARIQLYSQNKLERLKATENRLINLAKTTRYTIYAVTVFPFLLASKYFLDKDPLALFAAIESTIVAPLFWKIIPHNELIKVQNEYSRRVSVLESRLTELQDIHTRTAAEAEKPLQREGGKEQ